MDKVSYFLLQHILPTKTQFITIQDSVSKQLKNSPKINEGMIKTDNYSVTQLPMR